MSSWSGAKRMTGRDRQSGEPNPPSSPKTFVTRVTGVARPTPRFARLTFGGGDLDGFVSLGPGEFVYVLLPPAGRSELTIDQGFTWERFRKMPEEERPRGAYYTIREHRPEKAEVDLDFLLYAEDLERDVPAPGGEVLENSASRWAARAKPGDAAALWGPRIAYGPPPGTDWQLLVADETGLPAAAAILRSLPEDACVRAFIEVADKAEEQHLDSAGDVQITWLHRKGTPPGRSASLVEAVRSLEFPEGAVYVWGAGESQTVTALRRHLRDERGLAAGTLSLTAYWRHANHRTDEAG